MLHKFIADCWQAYGPSVTFHVGDLHWRLRPQLNHHPERDIRLWHTGERLVAFAWFDFPCSGDLQCYPGSDRQLMEPELLSWLEQQARAQGARGMTVGAFQGDRVREALLQARGYRQQSTFICHMIQPLALAPAPAPAPLPHGYAISHTTTTDLESLANTSALAFQSPPKPISVYLKMRASHFYQNDLDLVVKSDCGEVVAFCMAWLDKQNAVGLLEPVGCHPDYQRQGLAAAVVTAALDALCKVGAHTAIVYPNGNNQAARALYEKCGFRAVASDYDWYLAFSG